MPTCVLTTLHSAQRDGFYIKHKRVVFVTTRFAGSGSLSRLLSLFLFLLDFNNFAAFVKSAIRTDGMGKAHRTAIRAGDQVMGLQSVVRAAHITAALGMFALWMKSEAKRS